MASPRIGFTAHLPVARWTVIMHDATSGATIANVVEAFNEFEAFTAAAASHKNKSDLILVAAIPGEHPVYVPSESGRGVYVEDHLPWAAH